MFFPSFPFWLYISDASLVLAMGKNPLCLRQTERMFSKSKSLFSTKCPLCFWEHYLLSRSGRTGRGGGNLVLKKNPTNIRRFVTLLIMNVCNRMRVKQLGCRWKQSIHHPLTLCRPTMLGTTSLFGGLAKASSSCLSLQPTKTCSPSLIPRLWPYLSISQQVFFSDSVMA